MAEYRLKIHPDFWGNYGPDRYGRPLMSAPSEWEEARRETVQEARRRLVQDIKDGRGGQGDADKHLGDAAKMALEAVAFEAGAGLLRRGASAVKNAMAAPKLELGEAFAASGRAIKDMAAVAGRRAALDHAHRVVPGIREKIAEETRRRLVELAANPRDWSKATLRAGRGTGLDRLESDLAQGYIPSPSSAIMPAGQPWRLGSGYGDAGSTYGARIFFKGRSVQPGAVPGNAVADRDALSPSFVDDLTDTASGETVSAQADASRQALYREFLANPEAAKAKYGFRNGARAGEPRWTLDGPLTPAQKRELYGRYAYADEHGRFQTAGVSYFEGKPFRDVPFNSDEIGLVGLDDRAPEVRLLGIERQLDDLGIPHVRFAADGGTYRTPRDFREIRAARDAAGLPFGWRPHVVAERELHRYAPVFQDAKGGDARMASKAGDADRFAQSRNFLATDEVPETIFGIPVVARREDYTPEDIAFFRKHPEAGGYYDLGDEEGQLPVEPAPVQAAKGGQARAAYPGSLNNPGNVEKRAERRQGETDSPHERWAMFSTPQDGLYAMADSIRQIADVKLAGKPFTIRSLSEIYAPRKNKAGAKENDTAKYIRNISRYSGIDADAELDRWNPGDMSRLLKTMVRFESGKPHSDWFTDDEYGRAAEILQEGAAD